MKYIEFCAGIGGTRAGLDAAGWQCVLAVDHDPDAITVHRMTHGSASERDVIDLSPDDLPDADVWVAGFPCQPFSSSGTRLGFEHQSGNVFEHLSRLIQERRPRIVVLENVEGLLTNKSGHTFAKILRGMTDLRYEVHWLVVNVRWYGVPQSRPRLFMIAADIDALHAPDLQEMPGMLPGIGATVPSVFAKFLNHTSFTGPCARRAPLVLRSSACARR